MRNRRYYIIIFIVDDSIIILSITRRIIFLANIYVGTLPYYIFTIYYIIIPHCYQRRTIYANQSLQRRCFQQKSIL